VSPDTTTTYVVTASYEYGCQAVKSIIIKVNPKYRIEYDTTIIQGDTLKVGNLKHFVTGSYSDTLKTYKGCDSIVITNLIVSDIITIENNFIKTYPNPAKKILKIEANGLINNIELLSINGIVLQSIMVNNKEVTIDLNNYVQGIYILRINIAKKIRIVKIIIE